MTEELKRESRFMRKLLAASIIIQTLTYVTLMARIYMNMKAGK